MSTMNILIATDNHLGYNEKDPVRCNDSFDSFEEILQLARAHDVDAILLGGDLFHENKPSRLTMHRTMELLRYYCLGDRPCALELLSDPSVNFPSKFGTVNYEDPNYNVAMPVFVIHGNHDDPSGEGNLSPIDLLATAGLLNYFGKTASVDDITMVPILLKKGEAKLALYGLGGIRDERLHRTFLQRKVKLLRPVQEDASDWFSLLILHQNRVPHGPTNYIPESFLDDFLDLVVWGHEHESLACEPSECAQRGFMVCQPGSSVATSLCEGEAKRKHAVILTLEKDKTSSMRAIVLKTVRPFVQRDVALKEAEPRISPTDSQAISGFLSRVVEEMAEEAKSDWLDRNPGTEAESPLPLVRLRVDCSLPAAGLDDDPIGNANKSYSLINPQRFGQLFIDRVANPRDILHYLRRRGGLPQRRLQNNAPEELQPQQQGETEDKALRVEDLVAQYLQCQRLDVLPQNEFGDILRTSIEKTDHGLIERFVNESLQRMMERASLDLVLSDPAGLRGEFERVRRAREDEWRRLHPTIDSVLMQVGQMHSAPDSNPGSDESEDEQRPATTSTRGRGRGAARGAARGGTTRGRGRGVKAAAAPPAKRAAIAIEKDDADEDEADEEVYEEEGENYAPAPTGKRTLDMQVDLTPKKTAAKKTAAAPPKPTWPPRRK